MPRQLLRRRERPRANQVRLRCESFEERITPTLFNVQSPLSFTGLSNNGCVAVADFNKDGKSDAVLANFGTGYGAPFDTGVPGTSITFLYGNGSGGFSRVSPSTGGQNVSFVTVADINNDTWPDVVAVNANRQNTGSVSIFRNDGAGNLSLFGTFSTFTNNPSWVGLADVTGDNVLDVVVGSFGKSPGPDQLIGNGITIFQGNSTGGVGNFTYSATPITTILPFVQFYPTALAVTDFDGDGIVDIAASVPGVPPDFGLPQPSGSVFIFKGNGAGGFAANPDEYDSGGALPVNIQAADLNGDGKKDLIVANSGDPNASPEWKDKAIGVLINTSSVGSPTFGFTNSITSNTYGPFAVAVADFDMNGRVDIAAINYGAQFVGAQASVSIYMGNGNGTFTDGSPGSYNTGTGIGGGQYLAVGNFDSNPTPDLIIAHASNLVGLMLNTTSAATAPRITGSQINGGVNQRSRVTDLTVTFSSQVTFAGGNVAGAFSLTRNGGGGTVSFQATANVVGGVTVVTINNFTGTATQFGSLADGRYTLTALAANITAGGLQLDGNGDGTAGDNYVFSPQGNQGFFRLFGDANGDQRVDIADFGLFATSYNKSTGDAGYLAYFDFDGNGRVDIFDFGNFSIRYLVQFP